MNAQKITGLAVPTATGDVLRKGTALTITELPALTSDKEWRGNTSNRPAVATPMAYPS